ncbi:DUF6677 family protein [Tautonia sociabilis]|uniref:DUF6677 domain-containing protein n=1 Tax=Tautonia sociabilis TaxID=2080755 RepID=A0A432MQA4_9BACT|nr:DUF6677 family protein [Tautonia sociabilis]RUL89540.1 hypothetical protein TsocGM_01855 [Tautonia sociabilis]
MDRPNPDLIPLKNRSKAAALALIWPGLGHLYQGRYAKGILYLICIFGLYAVGFALGEGANVYWTWVNPLRDAEHFRLYYLGQFWVGLPAWPALLQATLVHLGHQPILDGFMAAPLLEPGMNDEVRGVMEKVVNHAFSLHQKYGGLKEVGDIYTTIAGLLNVLAIYDAFEGPADRANPSAQASSSTDATAKAEEIGR